MSEGLYNRNSGHCTNYAKLTNVVLNIDHSEARRVAIWRMSFIPSRHFF